MTFVSDTFPDAATAVFAAVLAGVFGLAVGSFLNVVVWRLPQGRSLASPPSACPACGARIRARDNVPVLSWLLLRGRCRDCAEPVSRRYPLVEAGTAVLFVVVTLHAGLVWALPAYLYVTAVSVALVLIDLDVHRLPDALTLPSYGVLAVLLTAAAWLGDDWGSVARAGIGLLALGLFYLVVFVVYPAGMGFGDVKLSGIVGLVLGWLGWGPLVVGAFGAFLLGGVFSVVLLATRVVDRKSGIPFGPWMIAGLALGALVGAPLWDAYLGLMV